MVIYSDTPIWMVLLILKDIFTNDEAKVILKLLTFNTPAVTGYFMPCSPIASPDESRGYYAFVIVMPPPHRFLVCALQPAVLIRSF